MKRRRFLTLAAAGVAAACPICAANLRAFAADQKAEHGAAGHDLHWSYGGEGGPEKWGKLKPEFKACELGVEQTPIDLAQGIRSNVGIVETAFKPMPLRILNNGHTIQVNCDPGSGSMISGEKFELLQFHWHHPSEHLLGGRQLPLELHFVHKSAAGQLGVLGVFMVQGKENPWLTPIWNAMPKAEGPEMVAGVTIDPNGLLPKSRSFFRYAGSLTTPPCSEGVKWTVFHEPVEVSEAQIRQFAALFPMNARPVQKMNKRFLLEMM